MRRFSTFDPPKYDPPTAVMPPELKRRLLIATGLVVTAFTMRYNLGQYMGHKPDMKFSELADELKAGNVDQVEISGNRTYALVDLKEGPVSKITFLSPETFERRLIRTKDELNADFVICHAQSMRERPLQLSEQVLRWVPTVLLVSAVVLSYHRKRSAPPIQIPKPQAHTNLHRDHKPKRYPNKKKQ